MLGADLVGMSTVVEAVAARALGMEVAGLSAVTTREGSGEELDPQEVVAIAEATAARCAPVLAAILRFARHDDRTGDPDLGEDTA
jgi:purine-nucleoside phosphorylase